MFSGKRRRVRLLAAASAVLGLMLAGCTSTSPSGEGSKDIVVAVPSTIIALDPHGAAAVDRITRLATVNMFDFLVVRNDETGKFEPSVATSWQTPDDNTWDFTLRGDITFSNGEKLKSSDVKASIERVVQLNGPLASLVTPITDIETPSDTELVLKTDSAYGTMISALSTIAIAPASAMADPSFVDHPIGSGPFTFVEFVPDDRLVMQANPNYWKGAPTVNKVTMKWIPEMSSRISALRTGEADMMWNIPNDLVDSVKSLDNIEYGTTPSFVRYFIWFNFDGKAPTRTPFQDIRVRQAMWYALDLDTIRKSLYGDTVEAATAPITRAVAGYAAQKPYAYNPDKAKQLLADAGYPNGFDTSIEFDPNCCAIIGDFVQAMVADWAKVGVRVRIDAKETAVFRDDFRALNWDMHLQSNPTTTGEAAFTLVRLYGPEEKRNTFDNQQLWDALAGAESSLDESQRNAYYAQAEQIIWDQVAGIYPMDQVNNSAWNKRIGNYVLSPTDTPSFARLTLNS